jgi:hypothetical protein
VSRDAEHDLTARAYAEVVRTAVRDVVELYGPVADAMQVEVVFIFDRDFGLSVASALAISAIADEGLAQSV